MNFTVRLTYLDDKVINVALPEGEVLKFLDGLKKNEPYWAPNADHAFWTANAQVRYVSVSKNQEEPSKEAEGPIRLVKDGEEAAKEEVKEPAPEKEGEDL